MQRGFLSRVMLGRPMLTLKLATSLDGRIATATGESKWITGPEARHRVHMMRAAHDAVMVGAGTVRADDPSLSVRGIGVAQQPVRIVAARNLDLPQDCTLARTAREQPVWLIHGSSAPRKARNFWKAQGARLIETAENGDRLDLASALGALADQGLTRIFCEGGGQLGAALLAQDLVDDLALFTAGVALGSDGRPALGMLNLPVLADARRFRLQESRQVGADLYALWTRDLKLTD